MCRWEIRLTYSYLVLYAQPHLDNPTLLLAPESPGTVLPTGMTLVTSNIR